jgi:putative DNA primase/helicase
VDEGDTFLKDNDDLRGILNGGHDRMSAYVWRNVGDDHEPRRFKVWAPKAIAMIGQLPDTLEDRAIVGRSLPTKRVSVNE